MGGAEPASPKPVLEQAGEVGRRIAEAGAVLLCGGRTGVMEAAARGAKSVPGGETLAILPGEDPDRANPYMDLAVATGMGNGRNVINILSSDAVIAFPGGAGTLSEMALALKCGVPLISLSGWDLAKACPVESRDAMKAAFHPARSAEEAVSLAVKHAGIRLPDLEEERLQILRFLDPKTRDSGAPGSSSHELLAGSSFGPTLVVNGRRVQGVREPGKLFPPGFFSGSSASSGAGIDPADFQLIRLPGRTYLAAYTVKDESGKPWAVTAVLKKEAGTYRLLSEHFSCS